METPVIVCPRITTKIPFVQMQQAGERCMDSLTGWTLLEGYFPVHLRHNSNVVLAENRYKHLQTYI